MHTNKRIKQDTTALFLIIGIYLILQWVGIGWHCPFHSIFGVPCPGCGFTRAIQAVIQFDFITALYYYPLFWLPPLLLLYYIYANYMALKKPKSYQNIMNIGLALILVVYFMRWFDLLQFASQLEINKDSLLFRLLHH